MKVATSSKTPLLYACPGVAASADTRGCSLLRSIDRLSPFSVTAPWNRKLARSRDHPPLLDTDPRP